MSASPVNGSDFPLLTTASSVCEGFKALLRMPSLLNTFLTWMLDDNDEPSEEFAAGLSKYLCPIGTVLPFAGESLPSETWLVANGQPVSRTTYADLYALIGTTYGAGDGSTTFNLPSVQGKFIRGRDASQVLGSTGGSDSVTLTQDQVPLVPHYHGVGKEDPVDNDEMFFIQRAWAKDGTYNVRQMSGDNPNISNSITDSGDLSTTDAISITGSEEAAQSFDNRPAFVTLYYIIKVK